MEIQFIVDIREKDYVQDEFKNHEILSEITEFKQLEVGDIWVYYKNELIMLIERKTNCDFAASIKDNRYKSQKLRMIKYAIDNNLSRDNIMYLIENSKNKTSINNSVLESACANLQIRDGFRVYHTKNLDDTITFMTKIYNCLKKYGFYAKNSKINIHDEYIKSTVEPVRKDNITPNIAFIRQLSIIPGMSVIKSKVIAEIYPSFVKLIEAYNKLDSEDQKIKMLIDIKVNNRKIGKQLSERVYRYLYHVLE